MLLGNCLSNNKAHVVNAIYLGAAHKLIGNALQIFARVCKVKIAINLVHIGKLCKFVV